MMMMGDDQGTYEHDRSQLDASNNLASTRPASAFQLRWHSMPKSAQLQGKASRTHIGRQVQSRPQYVQ